MSWHADPQELRCDGFLNTCKNMITGHKWRYQADQEARESGWDTETYFDYCPGCLEEYNREREIMLTRGWM